MSSPTAFGEARREIIRPAECGPPNLGTTRRVGQPLEAPAEEQDGGLEQPKRHEDKAIDNGGDDICALLHPGGLTELRLGIAEQRDAHAADLRRDADGGVKRAQPREDQQQGEGDDGLGQEGKRPADAPQAPPMPLNRFPIGIFTGHGKSLLLGGPHVPKRSYSQYALTAISDKYTTPF